MHERGKVDPAFRARDAGRARHAHPDGGLDHAQPSSMVAQHRGDHLVDAGLADDPVRHHVLGRPQHERAQLEGVDAQVEQAASTEGEVEETMLGVERPPEPEVRLDQQRLTDAVLPDDLDERTVGREEAAPDRLHQEQPPAPCLLDHRGGLARVEREGLLAQHVLPGTQEAQGVGSCRDCGVATYTTSTSGSAASDS